MARNEYICDCSAIHQDLVDDILSSIPKDKVFNKLAKFYKLLGDNTRCKILYALDKHEMCVCDLANVLSMTKSSISHQLARLRNSEIVKCRKEGKEVYYMLDDEHVSALFEVGLKHVNHRNIKEDEKNEN